MRVVLDTNVLLVSFSRNSEFRWIFDRLIDEQITLCVTTEILMEYEEIFEQHLGDQLTSIIMQIIENAPNVETVTRFYRWNLISADPDDNKFVDCAIAAGAEYLVTHDKHFKVLENLKFPKVNVISAEQFKLVIEQLKPDN